MFVAVAHTVSSQYPLLHCYSFPAPIPPPPSLRGGGGSSRSWCRLGGEAAGAGVLCITQEPHSPLTPHPSPYHITTSPHHMRGLTGRGRARAPVAVSPDSPQSVSMLCLSPRAALSHDSALQPPARPARHTGQDSASGVQPHTATTATTASQLAQPAQPPPLRGVAGCSGGCGRGGARRRPVWCGVWWCVAESRTTEVAAHKSS